MIDPNVNADMEAVKAPSPEAGAPAPGEAQAPEKSRNGWAALVICAVLATVAAWIAMVYDGDVSLYLSLLGLVASVAGAILVGKGTWRGLAITSAIASGVLAIVLGLFMGALSILTM